MSRFAPALSHMDADKFFFRKLPLTKYRFNVFFSQANPPQFDKAEELSQLRFLNESSVLHTLRQRYASNLIHTYAGESMVVINPVAPLAIYSEKVKLCIFLLPYDYHNRILIIIVEFAGGSHVQRMQERRHASAHLRRCTIGVQRDAGYS